ncbi:GntR family transcriptional regulator [Peptococcus simiae]|uniref:GntR family transcriptional regulator n=1 Tax=Peptococcus simiae TaxID=1643805 RepID=UPI00397F9916
MIHIDHRSRVPIYEQIQTGFEALVLAGALKQEDQLPSVRSLAKDLAINPNTIAKAYQLMEVSGFIYSLPGRGSFIALDRAALQARRRPEALVRFQEAGFQLKEVGVTKEEASRELARIYAQTSERRAADDSD